MRATKRALDVVASAAGLVALAPLGVVVAAAVKADGGPVFFRQERVGRHGRPFRIWKFRTMVVNAERLGPGITGADDPRITRVGRWLRRTKIDELPQLLNVFLGEMSLVGPRPELARYVARYSAAERAVLDHVPGITDPASLHYADEEGLLARVTDRESHYVEVIMPDKIRRNLAYAVHATTWSDCRVLLATVALPFRRVVAPVEALP